MIRHYYDLCKQGTLFNDRDEVIYLKDGEVTDPEIQFHVDRLRIYSSLRIMTLDELLNDGITKQREAEHPWELFGAYPMSMKSKLEEVLEHDPFASHQWWESPYRQAFDSYKHLKEAIKARSNKIWATYMNGPNKDDRQWCLPGEIRVVVDGSIYHRYKEELHYVRPA